MGLIPTQKKEVVPKAYLRVISTNTSEEKS
jgi:hypothetical protein